jgi:hypothetical protein
MNIRLQKMKNKIPWAHTPMKCAALTYAAVVIVT